MKLSESVENKDAIAADQTSADTAPGRTAVTSETDPFAAANASLELASKWVDNALLMLWTARRAVETSSRGGAAGLSIDIVRRHFHTDRSLSAYSESQNISRIETRFRQMKLALMQSSSIFSFVDDVTAIENTRGIYDSETTVAAYAYSHGHIALTNKFAALGPNCRAAVIIHQLAHYIDPQVRDSAGSVGTAYDGLDIESALLNVHCYPNFAVNSTPPHLDNRYGMLKQAE